ncbi:MBL fold metallo-hydrolase [Paenibacillus methanolicus]|uniref:Glyoxylase-like metal-dependent hydrolase (Beta-lactamase superfamily II) n=1 Tax=Paenibacillus methanolicus TaxID=582686 RepID=A0A5S5C5R4_9BACL|nr:MBL fold metallo-hydrolase [Paenibacillus methanolicus]TYP74781.1 glyoxylase-like metal-dependent hydrolase (beta-lactamase superfamily II) [Paenibacillus methanolicus]
MASTDNRLQAIAFEMDVNGNPFVVHTALLADEQGAVLVDTGIPGQLELIRGVLEQASVPLAKLSTIIITHQDRDHIGSLPELVEATGGAVQVLAHEVGVPYLAGEIPLLKSKQLAVPVQVDRALRDGDVLPVARGLQVVHTPGHTPDHISLYHQPSKTLIAGDALTAADGVLHAFDPRHTLEPRTALASIAKLIELDIETVIAYHGGVVTGDIRQRLRELVETTNVTN